MRYDSERRSLMAPNTTTIGSALALRRLAAGRDAESWAVILKLHGSDILSTTRRILGDAALAEDACQETLLQVRDRAGQFKGNGLDADASARNWIMRIACNTALHMLRQRKRAHKRDTNNPFSASRLDAVEIDIDQQDELARRVRNELAELPEKQRKPIMLHFFAGLSYESLSNELGCNIGTARVRVHRALEKLRKRLASAGLVVTIGALYALLESAPVSAAEAVLSPERMLQWQNLLMSSQHAAVNALSDGSLPAKISYAAASIALCGSLAFSFSHNKAKDVEKAPPAAKPIYARPELAQAPMPKTATPKVELKPASEMKRELPPDVAAMKPLAPVSRTTVSELQDIDVALPTSPKDFSTKLDAIIEERRSFTDVKPSRSRARSDEATINEDGPSARKTERRLTRPGETEASVIANDARDEQLVSPVAQLKMLYRMQCELNLRVASIYNAAIDDGRGGKILTDSQQMGLLRASDQQNKIARLLEGLAADMGNEGR
jgi:RNA polymerase sigma-70 factor, ECF subfamily